LRKEHTSEKGGKQERGRECDEPGKPPKNAVKQRKSLPGEEKIYREERVLIEDRIQSKIACRDENSPNEEKNEKQQARLGERKLSGKKRHRK